MCYTATFLQIFNNHLVIPNILFCFQFISIHPTSLPYDMNKRLIQTHLTLLHNHLNIPIKKKY